MALPDIIPIPPRVKDFTGRRFDRLEVVGFIGIHKEPTGHGRARFLCRCDCGNHHTALGSSLLTGMVKSCGCLASENGKRSVIAANAACDRLGRDRFKRHGMSRQPEHNAWTGMKQRCHNPKNKGFVNYGARGIAVCDRWRNSFDAFLEDMGPRPSPAHSLERKDNDGPYAPGNVRWATDVEQANNKRDSHWIDYQGRQVTLADAERLSGISQKVLFYRIKAKWPSSRLFDPIGSTKNRRPAP